MTEERDIGQEILEGIRELKAGKTGRVVNVPAVAEIRERTGLPQSPTLCLWASKGSFEHL